MARNVSPQLRPDVPLGGLLQRQRRRQPGRRHVLAQLASSAPAPRRPSRRPRRRTRRTAGGPRPGEPPSSSVPPVQGRQEVVRVAADQRQVERRGSPSAPAASAPAGTPRWRRPARAPWRTGARCGRRRRSRPPAPAPATDSPARASIVAATSPLCPAPTMTTSRMSARSSVRQPAHELQPGPGRVHRGDLDVHQADRQPVRRGPRSRPGRSRPRCCCFGQATQSAPAVVSRGSWAANRRRSAARSGQNASTTSYGRRARAGPHHRPGRRGQVEPVRRADQQHPAAVPDAELGGQRLAGIAHRRGS